MLYTLVYYISNILIFFVDKITKLIYKGSDYCDKCVVKQTEHNAKVIEGLKQAVQDYEKQCADKELQRVTQTAKLRMKLGEINND